MQQQEITGSCSFEPNSTKALKCLVSYIALYRAQDDAELKIKAQDDVESILQK